MSCTCWGEKDNSVDINSLPVPAHPHSASKWQVSYFKTRDELPKHKICYFETSSCKIPIGNPFFPLHKPDGIKDH